MIPALLVAALLFLLFGLFTAAKWLLIFAVALAIIAALRGRDVI